MQTTFMNAYTAARVEFPNLLLLVILLPQSQDGIYFKQPAEHYA